MTVDPVAQPVAVPQPTVMLDLDAEVRDDPQANLEPFRFNHAGNLVTLTDPQELDWQVVAYAQENPALMIDAALSKGDRAHVAENPIPLWKMGRVVDKYMAYYGLEDPSGNAG